MEEGGYPLSSLKPQPFKSVTTNPPHETDPKHSQRTTPVSSGTQPQQIKNPQPKKPVMKAYNYKNQNGEQITATLPHNLTKTQKTLNKIKNLYRHLRNSTVIR